MYQIGKYLKQIIPSVFIQDVARSKNLRILDKYQIWEIEHIYPTPPTDLPFHPRALY